MMDRLERKLGRYAIQNLTIKVVMLSAAVTLFNEFSSMTKLGISLGNINAALSGNFYHLFFYAFNQAGSSIFYTAMLLYMIWIFGTPLEENLGPFHYNVFIFSGLLLITLGSFFSPLIVDPMYLGLSIFLAAAYIAPDMEILLMFILPLRLKWAALIALAFVAYNVLTAITYSGSAIALLIPFLGLGNFLIVFGAKIVLGWRMRGQSQIRRREYVRSAEPMHRCVVCEITEEEDPHMDFRYCSKCTDKEYCSKHLNDHEHL